MSSLYIFDALVRAARSQVVKHGVTTPPESSGKGNCATFLSKIEGIVDGFFQDMISTGSSEAKVSLSTLLLTWDVQRLRGSTTRSLFRWPVSLHCSILKLALLDMAAVTAHTRYTCAHTHQSIDAFRGKPRARVESPDCR